MTSPVKFALLVIALLLLLTRKAKASVASHSAVATDSFKPSVSRSNQVASASPRYFFYNPNKVTGDSSGVSIAGAKVYNSSSYNRGTPVDATALINQAQSFLDKAQTGTRQAGVWTTKADSGYVDPIGVGKLATQFGSLTGLDAPSIPIFQALYKLLRRQNYGKDAVTFWDYYHGPTHVSSSFNFSAILGFGPVGISGGIGGFTGVPFGIGLGGGGGHVPAVNLR